MSHLKQTTKEKIAQDETISKTNYCTIDGEFTVLPDSKEKAKLYVLEKRLEDEVDPDLFQDPATYRTLPRVIDVLGEQLLVDDKNPDEFSYFSTEKFRLKSESTTIRSDFDNLHKNNPVYRSLRKQQVIVDEAINYLCQYHPSELNSSLVVVRNASWQLNDTVSRVRGLRQQVRKIRDSLINGKDKRILLTKNDEKNITYDFNTTNIPHGGRSLRELWLKKLECEAILEILRKLEILRDAPTEFDTLLESTNSSGDTFCRIGSAVIVLSKALAILFANDMAQIQGLHTSKIMDHFMTRKQRAEDILWTSLQDVLYLRTGNSSINRKSQDPLNCCYDDGGNSIMSSNESVSVRNSISSTSAGTGYMGDKCNEYMNVRMKETSFTFIGSYHGHGNGQSEHLIPLAVLKSKFDLETDELRCLEVSLERKKLATNRNMYYSDSDSISSHEFPRPHYNDPVLALRILMEAIVQLGRLDDVERHLAEHVEKEIRHIVRLEQAKTISRLEHQRHNAKRVGYMTMMEGKLSLKQKESTKIGIKTKHHIVKERNCTWGDDLTEFTIHLGSLLKAFGSILLRLTQFVQILRHRLMSDPELITPSYPTPSMALHSVLISANTIMHREVKSFIKACLNEDEELASRFAHARMVTPSMIKQTETIYQEKPSSTIIPELERGIFSLGIITDETLASSVRGKYAQTLYTTSRYNIMQVPTEEFVQNILCPRTGAIPHVTHALFFRQIVSVWTMECSDLKLELAQSTRQDTSLPSFITETEETAVQYIDIVIKKTLLPVMQDVAVNGTLTALEKLDAFEPTMSPISFYNRTRDGSNIDIEISKACQALYTSTTPLFMALHKLPRTGEMYTPLVAVLEQAILLFLSRVSQRVSHLCITKTAFEFIDGDSLTVGDSDGGLKHNMTAFSNAMELRKSFLQLMKSYFDEDDVVELNTDIETPILKNENKIRQDTSGNKMFIQPLAPSASDTKSLCNKLPIFLTQSCDPHCFDTRTDLHREQDTLELEVSHIQFILDFTDPHYGTNYHLCSEEELSKSAFFAHSLLTVSSLLQRQLKLLKDYSDGKHLHAPRVLCEPIDKIRLHGIRMAKFCRVDMLLQTVTRLSQLCKSSFLQAKETVCIPKCVNDVGEYLGLTSEILRESSGSIITAYTMSSLEQYIPLFLMQNVRIVATGKGLSDDFGVSLNGIEVLDRSSSILYRELKSSTSFEHSFWNENVAADAFEHAACYISMMEMNINELVTYYRNNYNDFIENDFEIMFAMHGPRRGPEKVSFSTVKKSNQNIIPT